MSIISVKHRPWTDLLPCELFSLDIASKLSLNKSSLAIASTDFGNLVHVTPAAVLYPSSIEDIISIVKFSYNHSLPFKVAARGRGHSCRGQAMVENGVVIDMTSLNRFKLKNISYNNNYHQYYDNSRIRVSYDALLGFYADVGGEQLWIDVLHATLDHGVAPVSWTDYLYLTVGGTLSNAGISGQSFRYGPQITNVHELDVVTGILSYPYFHIISYTSIISTHLHLLYVLNSMYHTSTYAYQIKLNMMKSSTLFGYRKRRANYMLEKDKFRVV